MKLFTGILGLGAACAACCAVPLAAPLIAGVSAGSALFTFGAQAFVWTAGIAVLGLAAFLLWRVLRQPRTIACATDSVCGCSAAPRIVRPVQEIESAPIACALTPGDYQQRAARIRDLAARSLRSARRDDLRLLLTYAPEAADDVRALVREEQACCAFLRFDVHDDGLGIDVTIAAPEAARAAANDLFAHFAPELAHSVQPASSPHKASAL